MHDCLLKLLKSNDEDSLECLCRLVTTVGKELDHAKAKVSTIFKKQKLQFGIWSKSVGSPPPPPKKSQGCHVSGESQGKTKFSPGQGIVREF